MMCTALAAAAAGALIIVGGGLSPENKEVHSALIEGAGDGTIAIVPAASAEPAQSAKSFAETLVRYGFPLDRIEIVRLAVVDDEATEEDEATWSGNASDADEIAKVARAGAIWLTGGDQSRLVEVLRASNGTETPMLRAMRARLRAGAVIGGTSAGAAVMSDPMIAGGDTLSALLGLPAGAGEAAGEALRLTRGLGFFTSGIVDQHFEQRARLGRLARATLEADSETRLGFGIDEDTALLVDLEDGRATVLGQGSVTVVDARAAAGSGARFRAQGLSLSVLHAKDSLDLATLKVTPAPERMLVSMDKTYFNQPSPDAGGFAVPTPPLAALLGRELLDNRAQVQISRLSFRTDGRGVRYRFDETDAAAYYGGGRYTIVGVRFDIDPIDIRISEPSE